MYITAPSGAVSIISEGLLQKKSAHIDPNGYHKALIDVLTREFYYQTLVRLS